MPQCINCGAELERLDNSTYECNQCGTRVNIAQSVPQKQSFSSDVVAKLVALRLTLANAYKDVKKIKEKRENRDAAKQNIKETESSIGETEGRLTFVKNRRQKEDEKKIEEIKAQHKPIGIISFGWLMAAGIVAVVLFIVFGILNIYVDLPVFNLTEDESANFWISDAIGSAIGFFGILIPKAIVTIIINISRARERNDLIRQVENEYEDFMSDGGKYSKIQRETKIEQENMRKSIICYNQHIIALDKDIVELEQISQRKMRLAEREFGDFLHESDWANVDYLLYLFVSKRADTLKEALQLLDEKKQTDKIVAAISSATEYLANNISTSISNMTTAITSELKKINSSLAGIQYSAAYIARNTGRISSQLTQLQLSELSFSISSQQMMKDIRARL